MKYFISNIKPQTGRRREHNIFNLEYYNFVIALLLKIPQTITTIHKINVPFCPACNHK